MTPPDLAALARLKTIAEEAQRQAPGDWEYVDDAKNGIIVTNRHPLTPHFRHPDEQKFWDFLDDGGPVIWKHMAAFSPQQVLALIAQIEDQAAKLTLSRTAGRAEGLEEARQAVIARATEQRRTGRPYNALLEACAVIRALASDPAPGDCTHPADAREIVETSYGMAERCNICFRTNTPPYSLDPAPGDQPAAYHGLGNAAIGAGEPGTAPRDWEPRFSTAWEREDYERKKRGEPALCPLGGSTPSPAHPTEPGEVERLRAIETAARAVVACWGVGTRGETLIKHMTGYVADLRAALSTPQSKGETP